MLNFSSPIFFGAVKKLTMVALTSTPWRTVPANCQEKMKMQKRELDEAKRNAVIDLTAKYPDIDLSHLR